MDSSALVEWTTVGVRTVGCMISEALSNKIRNIAFLCALLVVRRHIGLKGDVGTCVWYVEQIVVETLGMVAVPFFFTVSGFFLAAHIDEKGWWRRECGKRIHSLFVPYLIWTVIACISTVPLSVLADWMAERPVGTSVWFLHDADLWQVFGFNLVKDPYHYPLWYIRSLLLLVTISPLLVCVIRRFRWWWLAFCMLAYLFANIFTCGDVGNFLSHGFSLRGLLYFSAGVFIQMSLDRLKMSAAAGRCSLIVGLLLLGGKIILAFHGSRFDVIMRDLSIPFLLLAIWRVVPSNCRWGGLAFPLYVMHILFFPYVDAVIPRILPQIAPEMLAGIRFLVGVSASLVVANMLLLYCPRLSSWLFGGRIYRFRLCP